MPKFKVGDIITRKDRNELYSDKIITEIDFPFYVAKAYNVSCRSGFEFSISYIDRLYELKSDLKLFVHNKLKSMGIDINAKV